jgi:hypothetical protein
MSGPHLCIPRNETVQPPFFQNRIIMFCFPIPTLIYLGEIYIFPGSVCLFCCSQICGPILGICSTNRWQTHKCGNWDWGRTIPRKGKQNGITSAGVPYLPVHLFLYFRLQIIHLICARIYWLYQVMPPPIRIQYRARICKRSRSPG